MKTIITSVLALVASISTNAANFQYGLSETDLDFGLAIVPTNDNQLKYASEDVVLNPSVYISSGYVKSNEDVIASDNQVVQSNVALEKALPLVIEKTFFDELDENIRIVDDVLPEVSPLDFAYIQETQKLSVPVSQPKF